MFLLNLIKAGAGVGPLCGVQTLPEPPSSTPQLHLHKVYLAFSFVAQGLQATSGSGWAMIMSHQNDSCDGHPGSVPERVSWTNLEAKGLAAYLEQRPPDRKIPGQCRRRNSPSPGSHLVSPLAVPLWVPHPSLWGPKKSIGREWGRSSLGWDNKGTSTVSLNLIL